MRDRGAAVRSEIAAQSLAAHPPPAPAQGMAHADEIVQLVFAYIALLRQHGPLRWVHDETAQVAAVDFRFKSKEQPSSFASK